ncbi:MAG TPA: ACT domain-containing protein [Candidatus Hydrogenedentes bacterium]|nr:ACT domain-containing protein [Candidatus Hydrogenedentota bacterium]HPG68375.1 ACT domain-containing protein [Candidatus Hydrogenedentota bacterium]
MTDSVGRHVISVLARDHVGIIADVADTLYDLGANIEALSQTVVGHWFTMVVRAAFPAEVSTEAIKATLERTGGIQAIVVPYDSAAAGAVVQGEPYVVTTVGADKPGIVRRFARCFANRGVNIEDVWNEIKGETFVEMFHVTVPAHVDPKELRDELKEAAQELGVEMRLQHFDIFTATNSLSVHTKKDLTR